MESPYARAFETWWSEEHAVCKVQYLMVRELAGLGQRSLGYRRIAALQELLRLFSSTPPHVLRAVGCSARATTGHAEAGASFARSSASKNIGIVSKVLYVCFPPSPVGGHGAEDDAEVLDQGKNRNPGSTSAAERAELCKVGAAEQRLAMQVVYAALVNMPQERDAAHQTRLVRVVVDHLRAYLVTLRSNDAHQQVNPLLFHCSIPSNQFLPVALAMVDVLEAASHFCPPNLGQLVDRHGLGTLMQLLLDQVTPHGLRIRIAEMASVVTNQVEMAKSWPDRRVAGKWEIGLRQELQRHADSPQRAAKLFMRVKELTSVYGRVVVAGGSQLFVYPRADGDDWGSNPDAAPGSIAAFDAFLALIDQHQRK